MSQITYLIFCFVRYDSSLKWCISLRQKKSNFLVLHDFMKCFSGATVNEIVNKCSNGQFVILGSVKNDNYKTFGPWTILEIVDKNVFKIMTLLNNLYLFAGLKTITLCSVCFIWFVKNVFSAKIWFVNTSR